MRKFIKNISITFFFRPLLFVINLFDRMLGHAILSQIKTKGESCRFEGYGKLLDSNNIVLGKHIFLGRNFFLRCKGGLEIGDYTHISRNVTIHTLNHNVTGTMLPYDKELLPKSVHIGKYVWIGMNVSIVPGVKIGDGAIIGMGATISKDVEPGTIVVGAQQRIVGKRDTNHTNKLIEDNKYLKIV